MVGSGIDDGHVRLAIICRECVWLTSMDVVEVLIDVLGHVIALSLTLVLDTSWLHLEDAGAGFGRIEWTKCLIRVGLDGIDLIECLPCRELGMVGLPKCFFH